MVVRRLAAADLVALTQPALHGDDAVSVGLCTTRPERSEGARPERSEEAGPSRDD
ncbi:MAG TPA: hypothetical protein VJ755_13650 [Gemmatimonadales bacterium]|nr:hypothetical protein [Gemmatimonadales bacterium]